MAGLVVGGLAPFSTVDFPGRLAAVVFCRGCGWRCPYCHNGHLQGSGESQAWPEVLAFLERRRGLLEGVVFSGGEPLLQRALPAALDQVRGLGFAAGLHTGGARPRTLREALPKLAWVGFDFKAPFARYESITGAAGSGAAARESLARLLERGVPFEVRTTVAPGQLAAADLLEMSRCLARLGVSRWVLQEFRPDGCRNAELVAASAGASPLAETLARLALGAAGPEIQLRPAPRLARAG